MVEQEQDLAAQFRLGFGIGNSNSRTPRFEKQRRGDSRLAEADDEHAFVLQVQTHLNFNVVSANSAKTSDAIQKRTITFDSDQPSSSK